MNDEDELRAAYELRAEYEREMRADADARMRGLAVAILWSAFMVLVVLAVMFGPELLAWLGWP